MGLTLSLLSMTQETFVDSVDQDQTAQNVQSDLWSTQSIFFIPDFNYTISCNGTVLLANKKFGGERVNASSNSINQYQATQPTQTYIDSKRLVIEKIFLTSVIQCSWWSGKLLYIMWSFNQIAHTNYMYQVGY